MQKRKQEERVGPGGERRPLSDTAAAVRVGRVATGLEEAEHPKGPKRVLVEGWRRCSGLVTHVQKR